MHPSKVTIATVVFNDAVNIEKTILSVIKQNINLEYIIIDGNSSDGTQDVIRKYTENIDVFISEPDNGIYDAMNKAISLASGEWIIFMNAGDSFYEDDVLEKVFLHDEYNGVDVIYGSTCYMYEWGNTIIKPRSYQYLEKGMPFVHQSVFTRTSVMKKRPYNTSYRICADFDFFHWLYSQKGIFKEVPITISYYAGDGTSRLNIIKEFDEFAEILSTNKTLSYYLKRNLFVIRDIIRKKLPSKIVHIYRALKYGNN